MEKACQEYIQTVEEELEKLGIKVTFENGLFSSASGKNVLDSIKVNKATILTAKLEGFKDALRLIGGEK